MILAAILLAVLFTSWLPDDQVSHFLNACIFLLSAIYVAVEHALVRAAPALVPALLPLTAIALWTHTLPWLAVLCLFLLALQLFSSSTLRHRFRTGAIWLGGAYSLYALLQLATAPTRVLWLFPDPVGEHVFGTFPNHNHFAAFLELLLPFAIWEFWKTRRIPYALSAAAILISIAASGARVGTALAAAELLFVSALAAIRMGRLRKKQAILAAAAFAIIAISLAGGAWERLNASETTAAWANRTLATKASLAMIRDHPLTGVGPNQWAIAYPRYAALDTGFRVRHADNDWLEWTAEYGLPFALCFAAFAFFALREAWRNPWSAGAAAVLLHAFTEFPLHKPAVMSGMLLVAALSAMARRQH